MRPVFTFVSFYMSWRKLKIGLETEIPGKDWGADSISICIGLILLQIYVRVPIKSFKKMSPSPVIELVSFQVD